MSRSSILPFPLVLLAGCSPDAATRNANIDIDAAATEAQGAVDAYGANTAAAEAPVAVSASDFPADAAKPPATRAASGGPRGDHPAASDASATPDSAQGAADVVRTYYALIGAGKYGEALALREPGASASDLAAGFARYSAYHATIGAPGEIDAGAGQRFVTVPVKIQARLKQDRAPVEETGTVVLHRTGDVDGATAEQRAWHIREITLKTTSRR